MKTTILNIIIPFSFIVIGVESRAQSDDFYKENSKRIDAYVNGPIKVYDCKDGMVFPGSYRRAKIKSDLRIMSFVNSLFNHNTFKPEFEKSIRKVTKKRTNIVKSANGLIQSNDISILGKYVWVNLRIDFIDTVLVRAKVTLRTTSHGECGSSHIHLLDFKVIKDFFMKDTKILFEVDYDEMKADTIYSGKLAILAEKRKDYKFNIPHSGNEEWINEIFKDQYYSANIGPYKYTEAPPYFIKLIKENKVEILKDLLFSPSYIIAIHAMEALIYFSSINRVQLTKELNERIVQIKNGPFIILQQGAPDVFYQRHGYQGLNTTDEEVVKKYSQSM